MAKRTAPDFTFIRTAVKSEKETFAVMVRNPDGTSTYVGQVIRWWIKHLEMIGWEAIGHDGHRAVHKHQDQSAKALIWDGKGYPFPMSRA